MSEQVIENCVGPDEKELSKINKMSRRKLSADEVFVFSVVLCDNEVDRDNERFSISALETLSKLFVGKTGIFDHSMHGRDQCARIFDCEVVADQAKRTYANETYHCLKAKAYMPRTDSNKDLMLEIDAGIKKEVSVGCATAGRHCSICGADLTVSACGHRAGRYYTKSGAKVKCHTVLSEPTDAYEWSFVAVPAQRNAGVTKSVKGTKALDAQAVLKALSEDLSVELGASDLSQVKKTIADLLKRAEDGAVYRDELIGKAMRLTLLSQPALDEQTAKSLVLSMDTLSLKSYTENVEKALSRTLPICPQLYNQKQDFTVKKDTNYLI